MYNILHKTMKVHSIDPKFLEGKEKSLFCPRCKVKTRIEYQGIYRNNDDTFFTIVKCIDCNKLTFLLYGDVTRNDKKRVKYTSIVADGITKVELIYSYPSESETKVEDVPPNITNSYLEGIRCLDANSPNGAVTMFRRALGQICVKLGANASHRLVDQIKVLPSEVQPTATEIKQYGNFGAHEDSEGKIIEVSKQQAESIKRFLERVFLVVYQHPAELKRLQAERK